MHLSVCLYLFACIRTCLCVYVCPSCICVSFCMTCVFLLLYGCVSMHLCVILCVCVCMHVFVLLVCSASSASACFPHHPGPGTLGTLCELSPSSGSHTWPSFPWLLSTECEKAGISVHLWDFSHFSKWWEWTSAGELELCLSQVCFLPLAPATHLCLSLTCLTVYFPFLVVFDFLPRPSFPGSVPASFSVSLSSLCTVSPSLSLSSQPPERADSCSSGRREDRVGS